MQSPQLKATTEANHAECEALKAAFLARLETCWPRIAQAYKPLNIPRTTTYRWRAEDETFRSKWDDIQELHLDNLEGCVVDASQTRGGAGYAFPVLKAYRRNRYGDRIEHSGQVTTIGVSQRMGSLTDVQ